MKLKQKTSNAKYYIKCRIIDNWHRAKRGFRSIIPSYNLSIPPATDYYVTAILFKK